MLFQWVSCELPVHCGFREPHLSKASSPQQGQFCLATAAVAVFPTLTEPAPSGCPSDTPAPAEQCPLLRGLFPLHGAPPPRVCFNDSNLFPDFTSHGGGSCFQKLLLPRYLRISFFTFSVVCYIKCKRKSFPAKNEEPNSPKFISPRTNSAN